MEPTKLLAVMMLLGVLSSVAADSPIRKDDNISDFTEGSAGLRQALKELFQLLREGKSGDDVKTLLSDIVDRASALLKNLGADTSLQTSSESESAPVTSNDVLLHEVADVDGRLVLLSHYQDSLLQAIDSGNNGSIVENLFAIKHQASQLIRLIRNLGIDYVQFPSGSANSGRNRVTRARCNGIKILAVCFSAKIKIDIKIG